MLDLQSRVELFGDHGRKNRGDVMNKVFINKETNIVEQILQVQTEDELPDDYFPNCYPVIDREGKINAYNLRYNKDTKEFEIVEGVPAIAKVKVIKQPTVEDFKEIKEENEELKTRLEKIEELLNVR